MSPLILLPGNSVGNRESIEQIRDEIGGAVQYYDHWDSGASEVDFAAETQKLKDTANGKPIRILAKSAGCLVAMKAYYDLGVEIEKAVFLGVAANWGEERNMPVRKWIKKWNVATLFIHKEHDFVIEASELSELIGDRNEIFVLPGNNHDYNEFEKFMPKLKEMLG